MKHLASPRFPRMFAALAAVLTLSLGFTAGDSFAAPRGDRHGSGYAYHEMRGMVPMFHQRVLPRLHGELKLDARQETLWKAARDSVREHRGMTRESFRKEHKEIKALLDQPGADLRAIAKRMDELRTENLKQRDAVRDRWLVVYDSLSAEQKEKARVFFKNRMERMEHFGKKTRDRSERGGWRDDDHRRDRRQWRDRH